MIQVWNLNKDRTYKGVSEFIDEEAFNKETMTTVPLLIGYIKPLFNGEEWVEGATDEEIQAWKDSQIVNNEPTLEELQIEQNVDIDYRLSLIEMGL